MISARCQACDQVWQIRSWEKIPTGLIFCEDCDGPPTVCERIPVWIEVQDLHGRIIEVPALGD